MTRKHAMPSAAEARCEAVVWKRDSYRYTGGVKGGYELHYSKERCSRRAVEGGLCRQHAEIAKTCHVSRWRS